VISIWTDGSASIGRGGWAFVAEQDGTIRHEQSGTAEGRSERMELMAVVEALRWAQGTKGLVRIVSDHQTIVLKAKRIIPHPRGRKKYARLWEDFDQLSKLLCDRVEFAWVKGHSGEPFNERADHLAAKARGKGVKVEFGSEYDHPVRQRLAALRARI
jgi:ribonuclease HI